MNNPITVKIESNIDITDEHKNEMREKLIYVFIEQLRRSGMYKVTEEKDGNLWILRADLVLPKKYEAEPVNGWISVKDRLPPYEERVLVINEAYGAEHRYTKYNIGVTVRSPHLDFTFWGHKVTHWQPLPEPPKGE